MRMCWGSRKRGKIYALLLGACQPSRRATTHGRAVAHTAVRQMVVRLHPLLETVSVAGMMVLVGTHPQVVGHVLAVKESLGTGKGEHGVVGEMCTRREHLHGIIVFCPP